MIIYQVRNPYLRVALFVLPLIIFLIVYFTAIKPSTDTANQAVKSATQQAQQQINEARKNAPAGAQKALDQASKLNACVMKAGTDAGKLMACRNTYGG